MCECRDACFRWYQIHNHFQWKPMSWEYFGTLLWEHGHKLKNCYQAVPKHPHMTSVLTLLLLTVARLVDDIVSKIITIGGYHLLYTKLDFWRSNIFEYRWFPRYVLSKLMWCIALVVNCSKAMEKHMKHIVQYSTFANCSEKFSAKHDLTWSNLVGAQGSWSESRGSNLKPQVILSDPWRTSLTVLKIHTD